MWKIQKLADGDYVLLGISGRMEGEQLGELQRIVGESGGRSIVLDLRDVKLVDRATVTFLAECEATGTTLRNCPGYIREWITRERAASGVQTGGR